MSYYLALGLQTVKEAKAYRLNFILSFLVILIPLAGQLLLSKFIYARGFQIGSWQLNQLLAYYLVAIISGEFFSIGTWWDIVSDIKNGGLNSHLLKPYSYFWHNFTVYYTLRIVSISFAIVVAYLAYVVVSGSLIPQLQLINLVQFLFLAFIIAPLSFLITYGLSLLTFFFTDIGFIAKLLGILLPFASGNILPLDVFPHQIREILIRLPSAYLVYHPSCIMSGMYTWREFIGLIIEALLWLLLFIFIVWRVWSKGKKSYEAIG